MHSMRGLCGALVAWLGLMVYLQLVLRLLLRWGQVVSVLPRKPVE